MKDKSQAVRIRLTIDLSARLSAIVDRIALETGRNKPEVFKFAIEFLDAAIAAKKEGMDVGAWSEKSGHRREKVFVGL